MVTPNSQLEQGLETRLHELDHLVPDPSPLLEVMYDLTVGLWENLLTERRVERTDWRPCVELCQSIREDMRLREAFPSRAAREDFLVRFRAVQDRLNEVRKAEQAAFAAQSERLKDHFLLEFTACEPPDGFTEYLNEVAAHFAGVDRLAEAREEMKEKGRQLKELRQELVAHRTHMFKADRDECFDALRDVQERHDDFWVEYKEATQRWKEAREERRREWEERTRAQIDRNREELAAKEEKLDRVQANLEKLQEMLDSARSDERREQVEAWIQEAEATEDRLQQRIQRLEAWIEQDEERLDG